MDWLIPAGQFAEHLLVAVVAVAVSALAVVIHYEGLHALARHYTQRPPRRSRRAMLKIMFALVTLHIVEIWGFGLAYWALLKVPQVGSIHGEHGVDNVFDAVYLSATTFSTLGFGDLAPIGAIRLVSGMEAVVGLLLITWSASFTYFEMSRLWRAPMGEDD